MIMIITECPSGIDKYGTTGALNDCFILVTNHQQCIWIALELGREPGMNDSHPDIIAAKLTGLALNGLENLNTTSYNTNRSITDLLRPQTVGQSC